MEVQRLLASFPCCSSIKHGVPGMEPQKHRVYFSHSSGTAYGSRQLTEFVGQWFDTVWQILVVLSVLVDCPVPVVCERLQILPYHSRIFPFRKGGELESPRSLIFAKRCNAKPQVMVSSAFCT